MRYKYLSHSGMDGVSKRLGKIIRLDQLANVRYQHARKP